MEDDESLMDTVKTLFYAIVIAILIRTFLFEPLYIPYLSNFIVASLFSFIIAVLLFC